MRKFTVRDKNKAFVCANCNREILPLSNGSIRNHCPFCLYSIHIDINPGDRACDCLGSLEPIAVEQSSKKGWVIVHQCIKCGELKKNKAALNDKQGDNYDLIIELSLRSQ